MNHCSPSQGGPHVEVFSAQGRDPVARWKLSGTIKKEYDRQVKGYVYVMEGGSSTTRMQLPRNERTLRKCCSRPQPPSLVPRPLPLRVQGYQPPNIKSSPTALLLISFIPWLYVNLEGHLGARPIAHLTYTQNC